MPKRSHSKDFGGGGTSFKLQQRVSGFTEFLNRYGLCLHCFTCNEKNVKDESENLREHDRFLLNTKGESEKAFTLAEVLITLGIIGVIAAMTLPAIIVHNRRAELRSGLNTAYSLLQQALVRMNAEQGYCVKPSDISSQEFKDIYIKYFDSPIDCLKGAIYTTTESILCGHGSSSTGDAFMNNYYTYNKTSLADSRLFDDGQFVLKNGMLVMIENVDKIYISIDVNGVTKKPNVWGEDLFTFQLMENGKLLPMGAEGTDYSSDTYCSTSSAHTRNGVGCTYKALTEKSYWDGI